MHCMTQSQVAKELHLSTRQVRRIEASALRKLRAMPSPRTGRRLLVSPPETISPPHVRFQETPCYNLSMNSDFIESETGELLRRDSIISLVPNEDGYTVRTSTGNVYSLSQSAGNQLLGKSKVVKK